MIRDVYLERLLRVERLLRQRLSRLDRQLGSGELSPAEYLSRYSLPQRRLLQLLEAKERYATVQAALAWSRRDPSFPA